MPLLAAALAGLMVAALGGCAERVAAPAAAPQAEEPPASAPPQVIVPATPAPEVAIPGGAAVKVALLLPLSGPNAGLGRAMLDAAQMALFDTGEGDLMLLPRDTGGTAEG